EAEQESMEGSWNYNHLGEDEKVVIQAYLDGEFENSTPRETCMNLERKHKKPDEYYQKIYKDLENYGTLELIRRVKSEK
ncbi:MAG: hypothetical protein V3U24_03770, partial [Candidatus Neomarinimicrobiota bacterium]